MLICRRANISSAKEISTMVCVVENLTPATLNAPLKLVFAFGFHVGYDHGQHLFMNVNSRYPVRHKVPPGGSGERATRYLIQGRGLSPSGGETTPNYSLNTHAPD
jgi:hypothetical protein